MFRPRPEAGEGVPAQSPGKANALPPTSWRQPAPVPPGVGGGVIPERLGHRTKRRSHRSPRAAWRRSPPNAVPTRVPERANGDPPQDPDAANGTPTQSPDIRTPFPPESQSRRTALRPKTPDTANSIPTESPDTRTPLPPESQSRSTVIRPKPRHPGTVPAGGPTRSPSRPGGRASGRSSRSAVRKAEWARASEGDSRGHPRPTG